MSRNKLAIDPCLLAPQAASTPASARAYVQTGVQLSRLLGEPWVRVLLTGNAAWALERDGLLPLFPAIRRMLVETGIEEYDAQTVMSVVSGALGLAGTLERESCFKEVLFEEFKAEPDLGGDSARPTLLGERQRGALLCALAESCGVSGKYAMLVPEVRSGAVNVTAVVHDAEHGCGAPTTGRQTHPVRVVSDVDAFVESLSLGQALLVCSSGAEAERCIRYAVRQSRARRGVALDLPVPAFEVGSRFLATCRHVLGGSGREVAEKAVRAIVECVEGTALRDTHALRTSAEGGAPQAMRGKDAAFRADIDYEYHLHYWRCGDGGIELASVVTHNDFSIPR